MTWGSFLEKLQHTKRIVLTYLPFETTKHSVVYKLNFLAVLPHLILVIVIIYLFL